MPIAPRLCLAALFILPCPAARGAGAAPGSVLVELQRGSRYGTAERRAGAEGPGVPVRGTRARLVPVSGDDPVAAARRLDRARGVRWAEPNWIVHALADGPSDPLFARQGDLKLLGFPGAWEAAGIGATAGWPGTGGAAVGIVDSGIDAGHPDLA